MSLMQSSRSVRAAASCPTIAVVGADGNRQHICGLDNVTKMVSPSTGPESWMTKIRRFAGRFGVEQRGIERVPENERTDGSMSKIGTLWFSANMVVTSFAIGALAVPVFGLTFLDSFMTILFFNILGALPVCFFSALGPKFGLRQMVLSRFWFGYYGVKLSKEYSALPSLGSPERATRSRYDYQHQTVALMNILACLGWAAVNVIVGAELFLAIRPTMPSWTAILIITTATLLICVFGYRIIHAYERWSSIPCLLVFLIVLGEFAHSGNFNRALPKRTGPVEAAAVLSFGASVFAFATGWTAYAADYTVYQPVTRSSRSIFMWTFSGLIIPLLFTQSLGAAIATAMVKNDDYATAYRTHGIGGLLSTVIVPSLGNLGRFCLVILASSIVATNCPNIYSVSLTLQVLSVHTQRVPRFIWTILASAVYTIIAIAGYDHFAAWLEDLMLLTGYWLAMYEAIALTDHFLFRRGLKGYRVEHQAVPCALPPGVAAVLSFLMGVMGAALGMRQVWWTGALGKVSGADIGLELAFAFAAIMYMGLRPLEKAWFNR